MRNKAELIRYVLDELAGTYLVLGEPLTPDREKLAVLKDTIDLIVEDLGEELKYVYSTN